MNVKTLKLEKKLVPLSNDNQRITLSKKIYLTIPHNILKQEYKSKYKNLNTYLKYFYSYIL